MMLDGLTRLLYMAKACVCSVHASASAYVSFSYIIEWNLRCLTNIRYVEEHIAESCVYISRERERVLTYDTFRFVLATVACHRHRRVSCASM